VLFLCFDHFDSIVFLLRAPTYLAQKYGLADATKPDKNQGSFRAPPLDPLENDICLGKDCRVLAGLPAINWNGSLSHLR
jgi:hypothetical protein